MEKKGHVVQAHTMPLRVAWGDTDMAGFVFYPNFYRWMDRAAHECLASLGVDTRRLFEVERIGLPLLEAHCRFRAPLYFGDELIIETTVSEVAEKTFTLRHAFRRGGEIVAEGREVRAWVVFGEPKPKAVPIPAAVREALARLKGDG